MLHPNHVMRYWTLVDSEWQSCTSRTCIMRRSDTVKSAQVLVRATRTVLCSSVSSNTIQYLKEAS